MTFLALAGCTLSAALVYVVLQVRFFGEKQAVSDQLLTAETEIVRLKKTVKGLTRYRECLEVGRQALVEKLKPPICRVVRQYVHAEHIDKAKFKLAHDISVVTHYEVEFLFSVNSSPAGFELTDAENGLGLKISRPALIGDPNIKTVSQQMLSAHQMDGDCQVFLTHAHANFVKLARSYGLAMSSEEPLQAVCKTKALEWLREALLCQSGVKQVASIFVDFK